MFLTHTAGIFKQTILLMKGKKEDQNICIAFCWLSPWQSTWWMCWCSRTSRSPQQSSPRVFLWPWVAGTWWGLHRLDRERHWLWESFIIWDHDTIFIYFNLKSIIISLCSECCCMLTAEGGRKSFLCLYQKTFKGALVGFTHFFAFFPAVPSSSYCTYQPPTLSGEGRWSNCKFKLNV